MIISKTPYRISLFGGGTDYPEWFRTEGGAVLSMTIDKYCYISCRFLPPFFGIKHRVVWSHIETVSSIAEILHPAVREGLRLLGFDDSTGLEIHHQGDLPARSGIGSSSSFTVGLIKALTALRGQTIGKRALALKAIELEREILKEHVGWQDQVAAAYGGMNLIEFSARGLFTVRPLAIPSSRLTELEAHLMLFYTGTSRLSSEVAADIIANIGAKRQVLTQLHRMVGEAVSILRSGDLDDLGRLLHESWMLKRELSPSVTSPAVELAYETAIRHGALGGKLLGAGGTGFMAFYVPRDKQSLVKDALMQCLPVPFALASQGSRIVYSAQEIPSAVSEPHEEEPALSPAAQTGAR